MVRDALKELFPPGVPPLLKWRLAMFAFVVLTSAHIFWACGWIPGVGGFALASDMDQQQQTIAALEKSITTLALNGLRVQLRETRRLQCAAIADTIAGVPGAAQRKIVHAAELERLKEEYADLRGQQWTEPSCDSI
jgi:hypothetical protein